MSKSASDFKLKIEYIRDIFYSKIYGSAQHIHSVTYTDEEYNELMELIKELPEDQIFMKIDFGMKSANKFYNRNLLGMSAYLNQLDIFKILMDKVGENFKISESEIYDILCSRSDLLKFTEKEYQDDDDEFNQNWEIIKLIIYHPKFDINRNNKFRYPPVITTVIYHEDIKLLKLLLDLPNIDINIDVDVSVDDPKYDDLCRPLHTAVRTKNTEIFELLFNDPRIDETYENKKGLDAFHMAKYDGLDEIVDLFY